ncbi:MBL fold metallo-hydrolase [soil metagenome]
MVEAAEGVLWARLPLPFALDHVNVYLIEDGAGWALVDTGIGDDRTRALWEAMAAGPVRGRALTRIIVTHHHPDHVGLAGWLAERFDVPIHMTEAEYLITQHLCTNPRFLEGQNHRGFYLRHGMAERDAEVLITRGLRYRQLTTGLPWAYRQLVAGEAITIGGRRFEILAGGGHSSEQAMLHCAEAGLFFPADQVLARVTPNVSVAALNPDDDPLGRFLRSLGAIKARISEEALVLAGHHLPLHGIGGRIDEIIAHHEKRCGLIERACSGAPMTAAEILPVLFPRALDPHQLTFAFSETLAHVNLMIRAGRLSWISDRGVLRAAAA